MSLTSPPPVQPPSSSSPPLDLDPLSVSPSTLLNRQQILSQLSQLTTLESRLDSKLSSLISGQSRLSNSLETLKLLGPVVSGIENESCKLSRNVGQVAETALRVGEKVRGLDREQGRVKESIEFVQQVGELKTSIKILNDCIEKGDWEGATRAIQRATSIDEQVIESGFSEAVVPTSELPLTPQQTLIEFHTTLLETFLSNFKKAVSENDTQNIGRFFKLFPMIKEESVGLKVYAEWVSGIVRNKSSNSIKSNNSSSSSSSGPHFYSSSLTTLFESIAHIVSQHEPIVTKYYGPGSMLSVVELLIFETDRIGQEVLKNWQEGRRVRTRVVECQQFRFGGIESYKFTMNVGGKSPNLQQQATGFNEGIVQQQQQQSQQQEIDPKEVDALLNELNLISARWQLLRRFLYASLVDQDEFDSEKKNNEKKKKQKKSISIRQHDNLDPEATPRIPTSQEQDKQVEGSRTEEEEEEESESEPILSFVEQSKLGSTILSHLDQVYNPLEFWYLRLAIERAHQMDELDFSNFPPVSSSLDDVFYILKKILYRLITLGSVTTLESFTKELETVLDQDLIQVWNWRLGVQLKELQLVNPSGSGSIGSSIGGVQGAGISAIGNLGVGVAATLASAGGGGVSKILREEERDRKEKSIKKQYMVYLNNLDVATSYTSRLSSELIQTTDLLQTTFFLQSELETARKVLETLLVGRGRGSLETRLKGVLKTGLESLFNQSVRNRLRPLLSEVYSSHTTNSSHSGGGSGGWYRLDEDGYSQSEYRDEIRKKFIKNWDTLIFSSGQYKEFLSENNFNQFFSTCVNFLVRPWESIIRSMKFTQLGALRLDSDLRSIQSHLSSQSPLSSGSVRESFSRLSQISTILCCDTREEVEEVVLNTTTTTGGNTGNTSDSGGTSSGGRLTKGEVEAVWKLRVQKTEKRFCCEL
ncbi:hypothetical protein JCM5350_005296 [Sporobolomyces pararoseus]